MNEVLSKMAPPERNPLSIWVLAAFIGILTWPGNEFSTEGGVLWYQTRIQGVPISYAVLAGVLFLVSLFATRRRTNVTARLKKFRIWGWVLAGWATLILALIGAILRQSKDPFVDWRNWAVLAVTVPVMVAFLEGRKGGEFLLPNLAIVYGAFATGVLVNWMLGGGSDLFGVRIPLFDGYDLALAVFGAAVSISCLIFRRPSVIGPFRGLLLLSAVANSLLVLVSFRRSIWAYLVVAVIAVIVYGLRTGRLSMMTAFRLAAAAAVVVAIAVASIGSDVIGERLSSFNPFVEENDFSATNRDHVNDLGDAWRVIGENPVLGIGIGENYETQLIANWKPESFEVHNAFLNAWLKFGILGVVSFIGFHAALVAALLRAGKAGRPDLLAVGCVIVGEQVVNLVQTWIYNSIQHSFLRGIVLAVLLTEGWRAIRKDDRLLAQVA